MNTERDLLLMRHARIMRMVDISIASANRETAMGGWTCDWAKGVEIMLDEAQEIERKYNEQ